MKIKDLPKDKSLEGVVFLHPETKEHCIWKSQWIKGIWFKKNVKSDEIFPLFVENLEDALEFEVVEKSQRNVNRL